MDRILRGQEARCRGDGMSNDETGITMVARTRVRIRRAAFIEREKYSGIRPNTFIDRDAMRCRRFRQAGLVTDLAKRCDSKSKTRSEQHDLWRLNVSFGCPTGHPERGFSFGVRCMRDCCA